MEAMFGRALGPVEQQRTGISILRGWGRAAVGIGLCAGLCLGRLNDGYGRCKTARLQLLGKFLEFLLPLLLILQTSAVRIEKTGTGNAGNRHLISPLPTKRYAGIPLSSSRGHVIGQTWGVRRLS